MAKETDNAQAASKPLSEFTRAHLARPEPGSQNVFQRAMESHEFNSNSEQMQPLVKLRRNTSIAAVAGFVIGMILR
jgi:hypothetical protein